MITEENRLIGWLCKRVHGVQHAGARGGDERHEDDEEAEDSHVRMGRLGSDRRMGRPRIPDRMDRQEAAAWTRRTVHPRQGHAARSAREAEEEGVSYDISLCDRCATEFPIKEVNE